MDPLCASVAEVQMKNMDEECEKEKIRSHPDSTKNLACAFSVTIMSLYLVII